VEYVVKDLLILVEKIARIGEVNDADRPIWNTRNGKKRMI